MEDEYEFWVSFWLIIAAVIVLIGLMVVWNNASVRAHELELAKIKCTTQQETQK